MARFVRRKTRARASLTLAEPCVAVRNSPLMWSNVGGGLFGGRVGRCEARGRWGRPGIQWQLQSFADVIGGDGILLGRCPIRVCPRRAVGRNHVGRLGAVVCVPFGLIRLGDVGKGSRPAVTNAIRHRDVEDRARVVAVSSIRGLEDPEIPAGAGPYVLQVDPSQRL